MMLAKGGGGLAFVIELWRWVRVQGNAIEKCAVVNSLTGLSLPPCR
jgi:hypothetical protein